MSAKVDYFLKKNLGEDYLSSLEKFELWKPGTRTTIDHEELRTALQIVPRTIMALLIRELSPMNIDETKEIVLPIDSASNDLLRVNKHERDVYSGEIFHNNSKVVDFKYRAIPGVGLVIMSAFELYDVSDLAEPSHEVPEDMSAMVQKMIDERMALHDLIDKVVDKKIMEKEAIDKLILLKLTEAMSEAKKPLPPPIHILPKAVLPIMTIKAKGSPLKRFLEGRKKKKKEFSVKMAKGETIDCPDCGKNIFDGNAFAGCVCMGQDMDKKLYIKKSEDGIKVRFGKGWDAENMEMLLEILRRKHG